MNETILKENDPMRGASCFDRNLSRQGLRLTRAHTHSLQINVGLLCNQACRHCHLDAGPHRKEIMTRATADQIAHWAKRAGFETIDITGGAPELNPDIQYIVETFARLSSCLIFRSNLTCLVSTRGEQLIQTLRSAGATINASFPSVNQSQADSQRGDGVFEASVQTLKMLNHLGYGKPGSGLELNLVSNPAGAFFTSKQSQAESRFRQTLKKKWDLEFNKLLSFSNVPLGRFRQWLKRSGNLEMYLKKLSDAFNPAALNGVMCRTLASVSWNGFVYDCDFNLAKGLPMGREKTHVTEMEGLPAPGSLIATGDHCFACTAGTGFT